MSQHSPCLHVSAKPLPESLDQGRERVARTPGDSCILAAKRPCSSVLGISPCAWQTAWNHMADCLESHGRLPGITWQTAWNHMADCLESHGRLPGITWQTAWNHMADCLESHGRLPGITWQTAWNHMADCLESHGRLPGITSISRRLSETIR